jgi:hypothetical protein
MTYFTRTLYWAAFLFLVIAGVRFLYISGVLVYQFIFRPSLVAIENTHDFGAVYENDLLVHDFVLENQGRRSVTILKAVPGCSGCVEVQEYPKNPVLSGERVVIRAKLNTNGLKGDVRKVVVVRTDDKYAPIIALGLNATIAPPNEEVPLSDSAHRGNSV